MLMEVTANRSPSIICSPLKAPGLLASNMAARRSCASRRFSGSLPTTKSSRCPWRNSSWSRSVASCPVNFSRTLKAKTVASVPSARNFTFSVRPSVSSSSSESAVQLEISRILAPNHSPLNLHSTTWSVAKSFFCTGTMVLGLASAKIMVSVLSCSGASSKVPVTAAEAWPGTSNTLLMSLIARGISVAFTRKSTADCSSSIRAWVF
mmetsp:Transcript_42568/g.92513  ORF Transcript_42568/g.92513 Transcript_42568/m.92513 type:complete len:207 (+) Transcript_42568:802-1422(+)